MPLNIPGLLVPFHLVVNPKLVLPGLIVRDIRQLDFVALRTAGYRGAVFDKDNCLTLPHHDALVPELQDAWKEVRETFGERNVLVVSNSAGSRSDAGDIQAESVEHYLSVPVLRHLSLKPSYSCIAQIRAYFTSLPEPVPPEALVVVGDRIFTDVVMANRMVRRQRDGPLEKGEKHSLGDRPLAVWTDCVWQRESMVMRWFERGLIKGVQRWISKPDDAECRRLEQFVKPVVDDVPPAKETLLARVWGRLRRT